jgi:RNA polymerase sigma-70 factor (ECF subfamily)
MPREQLEDILERLRADDRDALKALFQEHYLQVCAVMRRFISDHGLVEDLAQEVFLRFWEKRGQIVITASIGAYLRRMAINEALGYLRRNKYLETQEMEAGLAPDTAGSGEELYLRAELRAQIQTAIDALPTKCRAVFQLSRFEELTYQEIADKMQISVKTVENQMSRALRLLRERLKDYLSLLL